MWLVLSPILGVLRAIPWWAYAIAIVLAWGGYQRHLANAAAARFQAAQRAAAAEREQALAAVVAETARRLAAQQVVAQNATVRSARAQASANAASIAAAGLRDRLLALQADLSSAHPSADATSQAARLAEILGRCTDRYTSVAARADAAIVAGQACVESYESLSSQPASIARTN